MTSYTPPSPAEDAFEDYLDRLSGGETVDVALFLEEHPAAVRGELERMIDDWHDMRGRFGGEDRPLNGTLSGGYRVFEPLGRGGMGTVYAAEEQATGRAVALKVLSQEHEYSDQAWKRFEREALLAAAIAHPRCVFVYGVARVEGRPAIAMERMPGRTLQDELDDGRRYSVDEACELALAVLDGLAAAFRAGVIHRDVKPSNCFLDGEGGVKIGDFGISRALENPGDLTLAGQFLGSAHYASPEQVQGGEVDGTSDIYSLGATLYALLTGKPPYEGRTLGEVLARVIAKPVPDVRAARSDVPDKLAALLNQAMARRPSARFRDLEEMRLALTPFVASEKRLRLRRGRAGAFDGPLLRKLFRTVEFFVETSPYSGVGEEELESSEGVLDTDFRNGRCPVDLERYEVLGDVGRSRSGHFLLGFDPRLGRNVWLHVCSELSEELPRDRDGLRLRHIETVQDGHRILEGGLRVDVYEDPGGTRLTSYGIRRAHLPWPMIRRNLEHLTNVLEGPHPPRRLGQLWVDRNGDLRVLDVALFRGEDPELTSMELQEQAAAQFLLRRVKGELTSGPVSSRVETLQRRLTGSRGGYASHEEARRALRSVADVPVGLSRSQRMLPPAMVFLFAASLLLLHGPRTWYGAAEAGSLYGDLVGPESPILYGFRAFAAFCVLFAFVARGSLWCTLSNLEVRRVDGRRAARWHCALRSLVAWGVALLTVGWIFGAADAEGPLRPLGALGDLWWWFYRLSATLGLGPLAFLPLGIPAQAFGDKLPFLPRTCLGHR